MIAGTVQFAGLLYWVPGTLTRFGGLPPAAAWGLLLLMAMMLAGYAAAVCALTRYCMNRSGAKFLAAFAPLWVAFEYLRSHFPFGGFPWLLTGYSQTEYLRLIQVADVIGVYGVSLLVVWGNVALTWTWAVKGRLAAFVPLGSAPAALALCAVYSTAALRFWDGQAPDRRAALLQGNLSLDEADSTLAWKYRQGYVRMSDRIEPAKADLLVLPESPSPVFYQDDPRYRETMRDLARRFPLGLVFNNVFFQEKDGEQLYYNSAFVLDGSGQETARYDKIHLVPFGEYVPLQKLLFFTGTISKDVGNYQPGSRYVTVPLGRHQASVIICFEAVFPDLCRAFVQRGSELIINLTNDGWYGDTAAPYQHLAMARWRAIENRRYLLRAANSGISAVIEPSGRLQVRTGLLREDTAVGRFAFLSGTTVYARHGSYCPVLCVIISSLSLAYCLARGVPRPGIPAS
jgi:apolipoprotein N-acyltransferase